MDAVQYETPKIEYHQFAMPMDQTALLKHMVYHAMDQLEGWCPRSKASVMMDLVLLMKPETVVEIGVFGGKSLVPMAFAMRENKRGMAYGIDPWMTSASVEGMTGINADWWGSIDHEMIMIGLESKMYQFGLENYMKLIRATSEDAEPIYNIDILHIDGNHSEETSMVDVLKWVPLVRKGGVIIFDDLNWDTTGKAVQYLNKHCVKLAELKGDNIWGIWVKP